MKKGVLLNVFVSLPVAEAIRALVNSEFSRQPSIADRIKAYIDAGIEVSEETGAAPPEAGAAVDLAASVLVASTFRVMEKSMDFSDQGQAALAAELEEIAKGGVSVDAQDMPWLLGETENASITDQSVSDRARCLSLLWILSDSMLDAVDAARGVNHIPGPLLSGVVGALDNAFCALWFSRPLDQDQPNEVN